MALQYTTEKMLLCFIERFSTYIITSSSDSSCCKRPETAAEWRHEKQPGFKIYCNRASSHFPLGERLRASHDWRGVYSPSRPRTKQTLHVTQLLSSGEKPTLVYRLVWCVLKMIFWAEKRETFSWKKEKTKQTHYLFNGILFQVLVGLKQGIYTGNEFLKSIVLHFRRLKSPKVTVKNALVKVGLSRFSVLFIILKNVKMTCVCARTRVEASLDIV